MPYDVVRGRTAENHLAARIGDAEGYFWIQDQKHPCIYGTYRPSQSFELWTKDNAWRGESAETEEQFGKFIETRRQHLCEVATLGRIDKRSTTHTIWGRADHQTNYARGIIYYSTPGHGGFRVSERLNDTIHPALKLASGWYEHDSDWSRVALAFPQHFTACESQHAEETLRQWNPTAWEAFFGKLLEHGQSRMRDKETFYAAHANDQLVVSAVTYKLDPKFVLCHATLGGKREPGIPVRTFLVPAEEYTSTGYGFVIDPERHLSVIN